MPNDNLKMAARQTRRFLEYLKDIGIREIPSKQSGVMSQSLPPKYLSGESGVKEQEKEIRPTLVSIRQELGDCKRCKLNEKRTNIVFGVGNPNAKIVFVGEGPGEDEDLQAEPFVGRAGQLLTRIIQAMGLTREDVYICNVVKCRPPSNRNPEPDEISACKPFLEKQIEAISPDIIVVLGNHAAQTLLNTDKGITKIRGEFFYYKGNIKVMPTYHPSYLLRNEGKKKEVWDDMQKVMAEMGLKGPKK